MTPRTCSACKSDVPENANHCHICALLLPAVLDSDPPMPDDTPPSQAPNFTKAGFGASGDVNNVYDASRHSHHEDKSQHSHVHYHGIPPTCPSVDLQVSPKSRSGGYADSGSKLHLTINIFVGLGALGLFFWFIKPEVIETLPWLKPTPAPAVELIRVKLNRPSYKVDELMEITVTSQQAGYLYVLAVWADGRVDTLFPNSLRPDAKITAGTKIQLPRDFPPTGDGLVLRYPMAMPALPGNPTHATESILAVLSPAPLALPQSTELASAPGFAAVGMLNDPDFRTRGPQPKFMKMQVGPTIEFGSLPQAAVHYEIYR